MLSCPRCQGPVSPEGCSRCDLTLDQLPDATEWEAPRPDTERGAEEESAPAGRLAAGTLVGGRYRIEGLLGRGGMGEVYRAADERLGARVALKLLPAHDAVRLRLFLGEVRVARQITHHNVCRVHDVGEADGHHFMTMELIEGEDLGAFLVRAGPLPTPRAVEIGRQVCEGLAAAHERGILHRDLKPANLMIDTAGTVRLADFGLSGLIGSASAGGTPLYMAPELFEHGDASVQSDLYALGLVLYELFTGRRALPPSTIAELVRLHREVTPPRPSEVRPGLPPGVEQAILRCLEKDPRRRPSSARAVGAALSGGEALAEAGADLHLRAWAEPELPAHPYPVLLPYQHPGLLSGREPDVARLIRLLRSPVPILGLAAPSGTGKSSLLLAGLVPRLRAEGRPVALDRHPAEPGLAGRLIGDLLEAAAEGGIPVADADAEGFVQHVLHCEALAGSPPVLVLDQFEDVLVHPHSGRTRAALGMLLAASCRHRPGRAAPPCRWLLAYREEYLGEVVAWLTDVTADARREGFSGMDTLPHDLSGPERFHGAPLSPLATPAGGSRDPVGEAAAVFQTAIEAPLALTLADGRPRYPWRFEGDGAARLARAFGEARVARPGAPLVPELQVVLAHLLTRGPHIQVPEDTGALVGHALDDHLRHALEAAFPDGRGAARARARALLALRELAGATGAREEGSPGPQLERAIGPGGREVLERLAAPDARLVVRQGERWVLSHDRLAEAVARVVDEEGRGGGLAVDTGLLSLRRVVTLQSALHRAGEASATRLSGHRHRQIARAGDALLWDDARRTWWDACCRRRRVDLGRRAVQAGVAALVVGLAGLAIATVVGRRAARAAQLDQVATGDPPAALAAFDRGEGRIPADLLLAGLRRRPNPLDILEAGLDGVPPPRRREVVLQTAERVLPLIEEAPPDNVRLASFLWALDYGAAGSRRAAELRERVLAPLRSLHPPPALGDAAWIEVPAGTFFMGAGPDEDRASPDHADEFPRHPVTVSAFRMLDHEVTCAEYRRLVPGYPGDDDLPVTRVSWYDATVYAAWLGGRLPTEEEWEYAARRGCEHPYCTAGGRAASVGEVAWWVGNAAPLGAEPSVHPARGRKPGPRGLFDIYGNVWEWTASWYGPYPASAQVDPRGPAVGSPAARVNRGGSYLQGLEWVHPSGRNINGPAWKSREIGFRPIRDD